MRKCVCVYSVRKKCGTNLIVVIFGELKINLHFLLKEYVLIKIKEIRIREKNLEIFINTIIHKQRMCNCEIKISVVC